MKAEKAGGYAKFESGLIRQLLRHPLVAVATHWTFQSLLYMDPTERWFKLVLDVVLGLAGAALLSIWLPWQVAWALAFLAAHTLNFLCNGHLWGVLKHYGMVGNSYEAFCSYTQSFGARAQREPALQRVAIYGSLARQQWSPSSDLDVRIVRRPGLVNGLRACWFALRERSRASVAGFPLDLYVLDNDISLQKLNGEERPILMATQSAALDIADLASERPASKTRSSLRLALIEITLLVVCVLPGLFYSYQTLQEPWTLFRIARGEISLPEQHIEKFVTSGAGYRSEHIGGELLQVALIDTTAWALESIGLLPIGSLLLAILYYAVARTITHSRWSAASITIYASWYYPGLYSQYGTQTYVWTNILFLGFLILFLHWLRKKTATLSFLIMLTFIATFLYYHTTPLWMMVTVAIAIAILKLRKSSNPAYITASWSIALFCIVFYFTFDTVVYGNGLVRLRTELAGESLLQSFTNKIVAPLLSGAQKPLHPFEIAPTNPRIATWTTLIILMLLIVPVGIWLLAKIYRAATSRDLGSFIRDKHDIFILSIIAAAVAHTVIYSSYGALSFRVIPLVFPLLLPLVIRALGRGARLELFLTSGLAILAIVGFMSFSSALQPDPTASQNGVASKLMKAGDRVLSDANTYGSLLLDAAEEGKVIDFAWLDSARYASLAGQQPIDKSAFDFVVADMSNKPITSANWGFFEPWTWHKSEIDNNGELNRIYDSEHLTIFQPHGSALPNYQLTSQALASNKRSLIDDTVYLFLAILILFFIPGTVFTLILRASPGFQISGLHTLIGLSIGLSISFVTFLGYIVNFTSIGLGWFVPLVVILPWVILGVYLAIYRPKLRLDRSWGIYSALFVAALLVWSLLSAGVAEARTQRYASFTEFFVTQVDPRSKALTITTVNRLSQTDHFTIDVDVDGKRVQTIGPHSLATGSSWIGSWTPPPKFTRLTITLLKDGIPYRELRLAGQAIGDRR